MTHTASDGVAAGHDRDLTRWGAAAETLLERALSEHRGGHDAIASTTKALACLHRAIGEAPDFVRLQADDLIVGEPQPVCSCPPDLVARGGYRGGCSSCTR